MIRTRGNAIMRRLFIPREISSEASISLDNPKMSKANENTMNARPYSKAMGYSLCETTKVRAQSNRKLRAVATAAPITP